MERKTAMERRQKRACLAIVAAWSRAVRRLGAFEESTRYGGQTIGQTERGTNTTDGEREKRTEANEWTQWRQKTNRRKGEVVERKTKVEVEAKSAAADA